MKTALLIAMVITACTPGFASAGSISDGKWSPSNCGSNPETPVIDASNVDTFNKSIVAISDWQLKSRSWIECLINEANADNKLIADSANQEQQNYREKLEKISAEAKAAGKALEQK